MKKKLEKQMKKQEKKKKKKEKTKKKKDEEEEEESASSSLKDKLSNLTEEQLLAGFESKGPPTDSELFAATGGARFGMRAQSKQTGKWKRSEGDAIKEEEERIVREGLVEWDGTGEVKVADIIKKDEEKRKSKKDKKKKKKRKVEGEGDETKTKKNKKEKREKKTSEAL